MTQFHLTKKPILIHHSAHRELLKFPKEVGLKFQTLFEILESEGRLEEPFAKKLSGKGYLFEVRVKCRGQWRAIYAYLDETIVVLSAFAKRTQKIPKGELDTAKARYKVCMAESKKNYL